MERNWIVAPIVLVLFVTSASASTNTTDLATNELKFSPREFAQRKERDFVAFDSHYAERKAERVNRARTLGGQVIGANMRARIPRCLTTFSPKSSG